MECGVLPYDHRIMNEDAEVFDLGQTLRDGVILCHLLNHIKPGSIDTLELSNIRSQTSQVKFWMGFSALCAVIVGMQMCVVPCGSCVLHHSSLTVCRLPGVFYFSSINPGKREPIFKN